MTLFQSLAFAAGFDPVKGPGSSCSAADASGQCVLPWGGGTKAVSSVVLVANGVSFAVCSVELLMSSSADLKIGYDNDFYYHWFRSRLRHLWPLAAPCDNLHLLGGSIREHEPNKYVQSTIVAKSSCNPYRDQLLPDGLSPWLCT